MSKIGLSRRGMASTSVLLLGILIAMALWACGGKGQPGPAAPPPPAQGVATPRPTLTPGVAPATAAAPAQPRTAPPATAPVPRGQVVPTPGPTPLLVPAGLLLTILEPANETVLRGRAITIRGKTAPEAVLSIEGDVVSVDAQGNFSHRVTLAEGPNVFNIIATDEEENEAAAELILFVAP